jgi:predicted nucleotidyltransferase
MANSAPDFFKILQTLAEHEVEFIIVGGICAVLHGAPVSTFDLDIVHSRAPENIQHLISALRRMDTCYRGRGEQRLVPDSHHLASTGHHLLMTTYGPLDVLGTIGSGHDYEGLFGHSEDIIVDDLQLRLLDLENLIKIKEETARAKDQAVLSILRQTLKEKQKT